MQGTFNVLRTVGRNSHTPSSTPTALPSSDTWRNNCLSSALNLRSPSPSSIPYRLITRSSIYTASTPRSSRNLRLTSRQVCSIRSSIGDDTVDTFPRFSSIKSDIIDWLARRIYIPCILTAASRPDTGVPLKLLDANRKQHSIASRTRRRVLGLAPL